MIDRFKKEWEFLSNFHYHPILFNGVWYKCNESAFQAQKVRGQTAQMVFTPLDAREAKKLGRKVLLRKDWEQVKDEYMYKICKEKFSDDLLAELLLETGDIYLMEGNTWNDTYWGVCNGIGKNKLGHILMRIRDELRQGE